MASLHNTPDYNALRTRLQNLQPTAQRLWGKMSVDQMLWHCNTALEVMLGRKTAASKNIPIPKALLRFVVIKLPWTKNAPTMPEAIARQPYDFAAEKTKALALLDEFARRDLNGAWEPHPLLGKLTGPQHSELQAKHMDHHLRQFGA